MRKLLACPNCRYVVSEIVMNSIKVDHQCPRCKRRTLSEFLNPNWIIYMYNLNKFIRHIKLFYFDFADIVSHLFTQGVKDE